MSPRLPSVTLLALLLCLPLELAGQEEGTGTLTGRVRDEEGRPIFAVDVALERSGRVALRAETDRLGFFRFEPVASGRHAVVAARFGYGEARDTVLVLPGVSVDVQLVLPRAAVDLPGVQVEAERSRGRVRFEEVAGATVREIGLEEMKRLPGVAEADPLRAVEVLPGVVSTSDFSSAFHVRGGSADQNLVLLDGIPIFSPFHLGGFFSVFNADMLERAELASGGFPARHGGRVSSVLSVETDPGDGELAVDAGVSLLASRVAVAGGLPEGTRDRIGLGSARWRVSARRSYFDVLLQPFVDFPYHLSDLQARFEGWTHGGDRIAVTAYHGGDYVDLTSVDADDFPLRIDWDWGNDLVGGRWTRPRGDGGSVSVRAGFSRFSTGLLFPDFDDTDFRSRISQGLLDAELDFVPARSVRVRTGGRLQRLSYDNLAQTGGTVFGRGNDEGWLVGGFGQVEWREPGRWLVEAGVRLDGWHPGDGAPATWVPSPRLAVKRFFAGSHWAVKASAGRYSQFLHSLRDEELPLGLDVWILSGPRAPHVVSDQVQVGVEGFLGAQEEWQLALEAYHRSFDGVVTFNAAENPNDPLDDVIAGRGTSYGADLLVRRTVGDVNGWLALSWLEARRTFPDPFSPFRPVPDVSYPPIFDRRVDADLVLRFPLPRGWEGGLRWNVGSGTPYTRAVASYRYYRPEFAAEGGRLVWVGEDEEDADDPGGTAVRLGDRNADRYPAYHRLDLSFRKTLRKSWGTLVPYVDILNVYNRKNVLFYFYEYDRQPPTRSGVSMFPILPSLGLEVHF
ncbi:MAG: TonB-dependent receptor [Gemmatimonadota bacterium]|jgi:hypothetical protein